ncbi:BrnT family toxin [Dyadobacter linearis]|uniref:BrnT family toxin n=1 Tax=Dyadobacter linearis TaxID=2823330 RepID=UPI001BFBFC15
MAPLKFFWDTGNESKSEKKHGISNLEAESIFKDPVKLVMISNRSKEVRFLCIGRSYLERILTSYFIIRDGKVRIIGTRIARQKEKEFYNKER